MNALVDATPISGPARVKNLRFVPRIIDDSGTLQMPSVFSCPSCFAYSNAAMVSAVSPDWDITTISVLGFPIGLR